MKRFPEECEETGNAVREGIGNVQDGSTVIKIGLVAWVR